MKKYNILVGSTLAIIAMTLLFTNVSADTYTDKYSPAATWSAPNGSLRYYGKARFNMTTGKYQDRGALDYYRSTGGAVVTNTGKKVSGSSVTLYGNASTQNNYTNPISRTVSTNSSNYKPTN